MAIGCATTGSIYPLCLLVVLLIVSVVVAVAALIGAFAGGMIGKTAAGGGDPFGDSGLTIGD